MAAVLAMRLTSDPAFAFETLESRHLSSITGGGPLSPVMWGLRLLSRARKVSRIASPTLGATVDGVEGFEHARERGAGPVQAAGEAVVNATSQGFYDRFKTGNW